MTYKIVLIGCLVGALAGCGKNGLATQSSQQASSDISTPAPGGGDQGGDDNTSSGIAFKPSICSDLSFTNVKWPSTLTDFNANMFALAMNISGSFEGGTGWTNISNNFDGQGLSLGLFNQNLGQGSLQPLMFKLRSQNLTKMKADFTAAQYTSVSGMLTKWGGTGTAASKVTNASEFEGYESNFSSLDDPQAIEDSGEANTVAEKAANSKAQASVDWAVANLYSGSSFKKDWKASLQKMAGSPEYVTLQVAAATAIHNKAMSYVKQFGFTEMRAYFFFFDIVVQNGGLSSSVINSYNTWAKSNSKATQTAKLTKILTLRLTSVLSQYRTDVQTRKLSVINGTGTVHGAKRDYSKEYCGPSWSTVIPKGSLP